MIGKVFKLQAPIRRRGFWAVRLTFELLVNYLIFLICIFRFHNPENREYCAALFFLTLWFQIFSTIVVDPVLTPKSGAQGSSSRITVFYLKLFTFTWLPRLLWTSLKRNVYFFFHLRLFTFSWLSRLLCCEPVWIEISKLSGSFVLK